MPLMDLNYPPEAEEFRTEIAEWLKDNLPQGWGEPGFSMTAEQRTEAGLDSLNVAAAAAVAFFATAAPQGFATASSEE